MTQPSAPSHHHKAFWLWVMCLTGVDYFSTLGYQPAIAFEATGRLAPLATIILVGVTLLGALPVYAYVAKDSPHGLGSIGMLERLLSGWTGKIFVLSLLGFAATDFVITKTLSAADAAEHVISNPWWARTVGEEHHYTQQMLLTMFLLVMLGAMFMRGFKEVIGLAVGIVSVYLLLNVIVIVSGVVYLFGHPQLVEHWFERVQVGDWHMHEAPPVSGQGWVAIWLVCLLLFPKLALGLSGFETGVAVMPLVRGKEHPPGSPHTVADDHSPEELKGRVRGTRKLLVTAALIMSVLLLGSSMAVSTIIPADDLVAVHGEKKKPPAKDRALAYIAHGEGKMQQQEDGSFAKVKAPINPLFGDVFGTIYDISTVVILWFAGASAMAGLINLVPQYLPRYGMAPEWARAVRPLAILFTGINLFVTFIFDADVSKQGGAYATGVLVLMSSACVATVIGRWRSGTGLWLLRVPWYFLLITLVFLYTTVLNIYEKPDGIKIASCFIVAILVSSMVSRTMRSTELRFQGFQFVDEQSRFLWESMYTLEFPVLVPHRPGRRGLASKEESIRQEHRLGPEVPIVFVEVELGDPSEFILQPMIQVTQEGGRFILRITRCSSIAHVIAIVGLELSKFGKPPEIHFGWSDESPMVANLGFVLFGEGNVPWMVRELIRRAEANPERQPRVVVG